MTTIFDPYAIPLVGRDEELKACDEALDRQVGCIALVGEPLVGTTRLGYELAERCRNRGMRIVWADDPDHPDDQRLAMALAREGLPVDVIGAARVEPLVLYVGDGVPEPHLERWARALRGTESIVVATMPKCRSVPAVSVRRLDDGAIRALLWDMGLVAEEAHIERLVHLSDGLPGVTVELAVFSQNGRARLDGRLERLLDTRCGWLRGDGTTASIARAAGQLVAFDAEALARVGDQTEAETHAALRELVDHGLVQRDAEVFSFVHRLTLGVLAQWDGSGPWSVSIDDDDSPTGFDADVVASESHRLAKQANASSRWSRALEHVAAGTRIRPRSAVMASLDYEAGMALEALVRLPEAVVRFRMAAEGAAAAGKDADVSRAQFRADLATTRLRGHPDSKDVSATPLAEHLVAMRHAKIALRDMLYRETLRLAEVALEGGRATEDAAFLLEAEFVGAEARLNLDLSEANFEAVKGVIERGLQSGHWQIAMNAAALAVVYLGEWVGRVDAAEQLVADVGRRLAQTEAPWMANVPRRHLLFSLGDTGQLGELSRLTEELDDPATPRYGGVSDGDLAKNLVARYHGRFREIVDRVQQYLSTPLYVDYQLGLFQELVFACVELDEPALLSHPTIVAFSQLPQLWDGTLLNKPCTFISLCEGGFPGPEGGWLGQFDVPYGLSPLAVAMRSMVAGHEALDAPAACTAFQDAATRFEALDYRWWHAKALLALGRVAVDDQSRSALAAAREAFDGMGAHGWRERCETELRRRGFRWSAPRVAAGQLSSREVEVLGLVREGLTNREIAVRLVLSENTVARHLTRIFRKLGVSSRSDAAAALDGGGVR